MCDFLSELSDCTSVSDYRHYDRHDLDFMYHFNAKTLTEEHTRNKHCEKECYDYMQQSNV